MSCDYEACYYKLYNSLEALETTSTAEQQQAFTSKKDPAERSI